MRASSHDSTTGSAEPTIPDRASATRAASFAARGREICGVYASWPRIAGGAAVLFLIDLAIVESNAFVWREVGLRDSLFRFFRSSLHVDLLPFLRAVSLVGVADHPTRTIGIIFGAIAVAAAAWLWIASKRWTALALLVVLLGALILPAALKEIIVRPPPLNSHGGHTFPSGHAAGAAAVAAVAIYLACTVLQRSAFRSLVLLCAGVGLVLGTLSSLTFHYPTDVVGGVTFAVAWAAGVRAALSSRLDLEERPGE